MMSLHALTAAKGCILVLCYLGQNGGSTQYALMRALRLSHEALAHAVAVLVGLGLCESQRSDEFPFPRIVKLTSRGQRMLDTPLRQLPALLWEVGGGR